MESGCGSDRDDSSVDFDKEELKHVQGSDDEEVLFGVCDKERA